MALAPGLRLWPVRRKNMVPTERKVNLMLVYVVVQYIIPTDKGAIVPEEVNESSINQDCVTCMSCESIFLLSQSIFLNSLAFGASGFCCCKSAPPRDTFSMEKTLVDQLLLTSIGDARRSDAR